ncbi:unnamed protein product [Prorocentrum cordatum]|uniref:Uncharacterized protein n=1 Tax=Prorocentrum cordatum TaxID=2364126 RepID=A0ABN9VC77_9DINO|nr:unnamed protein product [Polarella glacialis]
MARSPALASLVLGAVALLNAVAFVSSTGKPAEATALRGAAPAAAAMYGALAASVPEPAAAWNEQEPPAGLFFAVFFVFFFVAGLARMLTVGKL